MSRPCLAALVLVVAAAVPALAEDNGSPLRRPPNALGTERVMVPVPPNEFTETPQDATISGIIWMNRCPGGCTITHSGIDDARANMSHIPMAGPGCPSFPMCQLTEFATAAGKTGSNGKCQGGTANGADCTEANGASVCTGGGTCYTADDEWALVVQCMKEVYSPYNVQVTDVKPAQGQSYTMALVAGKASQIGWSGALGVAPVATDCSAKDNVISFSFANDHGAADRVNNLCWTAAQETAHAFGLDHEYQFSDGTSACNDPMTYRFDCGGQKFFRNKAAQCGEDEVRPCACGGSQNSHLKIKGVFGDGQSLIPPPTVAVTSPSPMSMISNGAIVSVQAGSKRGVETVELWLNDYKWAEAPGAKFRANGQPNPSDYSIAIPNGVPNSIIDIKVIVKDDLGVSTTAPTITVTKGSACTSDDACASQAAGMRCDNGRCLWDPPVGELGDECAYSQYCTSGLCVETTDGKMCSQDCVVGAQGACPEKYECVPNGNMGACVPASDGGGCCSVGGGQNQVWFHIAISGLILGFVVRRRRKR